MKTLTVRLSDIEAEALERLAYSNGLSQNRQITRLIAEKYEPLDVNAVCINGDLCTIERNRNEWATLYADLALGDPDQFSLGHAVKFLSYIMENPGEETPTATMDRARALLDKVAYEYTFYRRYGKLSDGLTDEDFDEDFDEDSDEDSDELTEDNEPEED